MSNKQEMIKAKGPHSIHAENIIAKYAQHSTTDQQAGKESSH
jgi:hypothetical protein